MNNVSNITNSYTNQDCFVLSNKNGFETQNYPDAPNHSNLPNSILKKVDQILP